MLSKWLHFRDIFWGRNHIATGIATDIATDIATTSQPTCNHIATTVANRAAADIAGKASEAGERRATLVATRLPTLPGAGLAHVWDACSDARWFCRWRCEELSKQRTSTYAPRSRRRRTVHLWRMSAAMLCR